MLLCGCQTSKQQCSGWINLFDGKTLDGWKASENKDTFSVQDGMIRVKGNRSHLFYVGPVNNANFINFEWKADVMTKPNANSGMYIHTEYQGTGWPYKGYEVQVNNTHSDWRKTGGLYAVMDVKKSPAKDNEWFTQHVIVQGKRIIVKVNGKVMSDYTEPEEVAQNGHPNMPGRKLSGGTIALQGHDPGSEVYYKNIMIKPLP
jgi:hypothetical protein